MAIMKLMPIRSKSYRDALDYVKYRHDEETKAQILDEEGNRILREDFYLSGINCAPDAFPLECMQLDVLYGKNQNGNDVKMYEIIISYHPLDAQQYLIDGEKAQELSLEFAEHCFPGTLGIACTHIDGDHHTGNHHTHIILSSVKWTEEYCMTMDHPLNMPAGYKLGFSTSTLWELKKELQVIVRREELHQDNLFALPDVRINDGEYWAQQDGQRKLDRLNEERIAQGLEPDEIVFRTEKQQIRDAVEDSAARSFSQEDFTEILLWDYKILVTVDQDRWRYGFLEQTRSYLDATLGGIYLQRTVLEVVRKNRKDPERVAKYLAEKSETSDTEHRIWSPDLTNREDCMRILTQCEDTTALALAIGDVVLSGELDGDDADCPMEVLSPLAETTQFLRKNRIGSLEELEQKQQIAQHHDEYCRKSFPEWKEKLRVCQNKIHYAKILEQHEALSVQQEQDPNPDRVSADYFEKLWEVEDAREYMNRMEPRYPVSLQDLWEEKMIARQRVDSLTRMIKEAKQELAQFILAWKVLEPIRETLENFLWIRENIVPSVERHPENDRWNEHHEKIAGRFNLYAKIYQEVGRIEQKRLEPEPERRRIPISWDR